MGCMMKLRYKLTDQNMQTRNGFQWKLGEWCEATGDIEQGLCSDAWLHCYSDPLLGLFLNPIYGGIVTPRIFEAEVSGTGISSYGLKEGYRKMKLVKELGTVTLTLTQRVAFGILCGKAVCRDKKWNKWADNWLSGKDRSTYAANTATNVVYDNYTTAYAAARIATNAAVDVADAAAIHAAHAAAYAAYVDTAGINLKEIAKQAMEY